MTGKCLIALILLVAVPAFAMGKKAPTSEPSSSPSPIASPAPVATQAIADDQLVSYEVAARQALHEAGFQEPIGTSISDKFWAYSTSGRRITYSDGSTMFTFENYVDVILYRNEEKYWGEEKMEPGDILTVLAPASGIPSPDSTDRFEILVHIAQDQKTAIAGEYVYQHLINVNIGTVTNPIETQQWTDTACRMDFSK